MTSINFFRKKIALAQPEAVNKTQVSSNTTTVVSEYRKYLSRSNPLTDLAIGRNVIFLKNLILVIGVTYSKYFHDSKGINFSCSDCFGN